MSESETQQVEQANASGRTPAVFVHGLWLLASSWDRWAQLFDEAGFAPVLPGWPDDPETVEEAKAHPEVFAGKTVGQVADHFADVIANLDKQPVVIGHSFGGLLAQILAGRGLRAATVSISPAPFRGVLPLPISALRAAAPVLTNPLTAIARSRSPTTSSGTRSRTRSTRTRPRRSTRPTACPRRARRCSRPRPRTSTRGPRSRSTPTTRTAGRC